MYGKEIHGLFAELLKIGRKKGVHFIAATQHPSVDVIKGMAKTNLPIRVAFLAATRSDSRVILDQNGAERLNGKGDGLLRIGNSVTRFQGGLVEDRDVEKIRGWGRLWREKKGETGDNPKRGSPMKLDWLDEMKRLAEEGQRRVERWKS